METRLAVIGSGPAGLMAAEVLSFQGVRVVLFEKRKGLGRKLLIAGSSGLNITNSLPLADFIRHYTGEPKFWERVIGAFTPQDWIAFIESLGISTFEGTSGRYFVENMKASRLLQVWKERLESRGVEFRAGTEVRDFDRVTDGVRLNGGEVFRAVCFALGGGSYEDAPLEWPSVFQQKGIGFTEFAPSNVGFQLDWNDVFLKEAEGLPIKGISLTSPRGTRQGEIVITRYGMEGTPVYFVGKTGRVHLDFKPAMSVDQLVAKLQAVKENLSPLRRIKKQLNLDPAALALIFHFADSAIVKGSDLRKVAEHLKTFPLEFKEPRPLTESISSSGGIQMSEIDENLMLKKLPGVFVAGEMLDWDVPTGGFLIQGCVALGRMAGQAIVRRVLSQH